MPFKKKKKEVPEFKEEDYEEDLEEGEEEGEEEEEEELGVEEEPSRKPKKKLKPSTEPKPTLQDILVSQEQRIQNQDQRIQAIEAWAFRVKSQ